MCGIAGHLSWKRENRQLVERILEDQHQRGPDDRDLWYDGETAFVSLGHNRLSILDLAPRSRQPFTSRCGRFVLTYNGEIYNYLELREELEKAGVELRTTSDTEVLLEMFALHGIEMLNRLNGMFAFGVWDKREQQLTLVRDRYGQKPLYFYTDDNELAFASQGQALAQAYSSPPDMGYILRGLRYFVYEGETGRTPWEKVQSVTPGTYIQFDSKLTPKNGRYYQMKADKMPDAGPLDKVVSETERLLRNAVEVRLRSDVPVSLALSGGLDSSLIASFLRDRPGLKAFCYGDPSLRSTEAPTAQRLAKEFGFDIEFVFPKADQIVDLFEKTLHDQQSPFAHPSVMSQQALCQAVHQSGYKVLIGGQGADEAFAGYRKFQVMDLLEDYRNHSWGSFVQKFPGFLLMVLSEMRSFEKYWNLKNRYLSRTKLAADYSEHLGAGESLTLQNGETLNERQVRDFLSTSLPTLLRYEDRNSMGNSVEARMPFMDYRLADWGVALNKSFKVRSGFGKWVLRQVAKDRLPQSIWNVRFKSGFDTEHGVWLRNGLGAHIRNGLEAEKSKLHDIIGSAIDPETDFSDVRMQDRVRLAEAIALYWLAKHH